MVMDRSNRQTGAAGQRLKLSLTPFQFRAFRLQANLFTPSNLKSFLSLSPQINGMFGSAPCETKAGAVASGVTFFFGFISFACPPANMVLALIKRPAGAVDRIVRLVWLL